MLRSLVGSEMCIRDRFHTVGPWKAKSTMTDNITILPAGCVTGSLVVELATADTGIDFLGTGSLATSNGFAGPLANLAAADEVFAAIAEVFLPRAPAVFFFTTFFGDAVNPASSSSELSGSSGDPVSGDRDLDLAAAGLAVLARFLPAYTSHDSVIVTVIMTMKKKMQLQP